MTTTEPTLLRDRYGRVARDLRVSLTDRCNLRCTYCMPAEGLDWLPAEYTLTDAEINRLIRIGVTRLGIRAVRFTGGEPLLRRSLEDIIAAAAELRTDEGHAPDLALTTNGLGLDRRAAALAKAGLHRVNISIDALDRETYARIARRDRLDDVLAGIDASVAAGFHPVKLNAVAMRGVNEDEIVPLVTFAVERGLEMRFIEQMPLGPHDAWKRADVVTVDEIRTLLSETFNVDDAPREDPSAPASRLLVRNRATGTRGKVGVIASVTQPFCAACDRTRLTADGQMRSCLFSRTETDLRGPMRDGATDEELIEIWCGGMWEKKPGHGIDDPGFLQPDRGMSAIGG